MAIAHWLRLAMTDGIGPILIRRIIDAAGGAAPACEASINLLRSVEGIGASKAAAIRKSMQSADVAREMERCAKLNVILICPDDEVYPLLLKQIPDPPAVLYMRGGFEPRDLNALAIVGSRKCSFYGREQAERFGALLAGAGFTVISGGARGIDSAAHRGALAHPHGRTIAVLGSGMDVPYPPENVQLFEQIAQNGRGAVVSEYPLGTPPLRDNFPRRNRIVSGMSRGVLVIEADVRSGALITARQACDDHGRTVFAIPGRIDQSTSAGPHKLIREGAVLTAGLEDILENLGPLPEIACEATLFAGPDPSAEDESFAKPQADTSAPGASSDPSSDPSSDAPPASSRRSSAPLFNLTARQQLILSHLDGVPITADRLIERTQLAAQEILQELTLLSLRGLVRRVDGQSYIRARSTS